MYRREILVINTGSTSTKVAIFQGEKCVAKENFRHSDTLLRKFPSLNSQLNTRKKFINQFLSKNKKKFTRLKAIAARGGLLKPLKSGVYKINSKMVDDLRKNRYGKHASNLSGIIAFQLGSIYRIPSFIVDPVVVDELSDFARISGLPEIPRRSIFHALNHKKVARYVAKFIGKKYENTNLIIAHLGGGISIGAHRKGRVIDVSNALDGEGPFSPERSGNLPLQLILRLHKSIGSAKIFKKVAGQGGLYAYMGTKDCQKIEQLIKKGDKKAKLIYQAMAYQIAKEIGACAAILEGAIDAIGITGDLAKSKLLISWIKKRVEFLGRIIVYPGENEMEALASGVLKALQGKEKAKRYA